MIDEAVAIHPTNRLAVVVAISDQHHGASCSAGGLGVVLRVTQHQRVGGHGAQGFAGFQQGQGVGFFAGKGIAALDMAKKAT